MKYIGLSGVAGAGKDLFFSLLSKRIPCQRFSLADGLKSDVRDWCMENYNIDPLTCDRASKDMIRSFLVFHGSQKRNASKGRYWIERLHNSIMHWEGSHSGQGKLGVITDIRYDDFKNDEVSWIKEELKGKLIHISMYKEVPDYGEGVLMREQKMPANEEETRNDPKLIDKADFRIEWKHMENGRIDLLAPYIDKFIKWYATENENRRE
tara:strand:+ start:179 stop:805 length:627 start_codon:yes stop_codon:yes gene_type:complete